MSRTQIDLPISIAGIKSSIIVEVDYDHKFQAFQGDRETPNEPAFIQVTAARLVLKDRQIGIGEFADMVNIDNDELFCAIEKELMENE